MVQQYMQGDAVIYKEKESGETVTIYHGTIYSGNADTSAGNFHWY